MATYKYNSGDRVTNKTFPQWGPATVVSVSEDTDGKIYVTVRYDKTSEVWTGTEGAYLPAPVKVTAPYERGTRTTRKTTASLVNGDRILVGPADGIRFNVAYNKTGSLIKTVSYLSFSMVQGSRGAQRRYTVHFQDKTRAENLAPAQSWHAVTSA